MAGKRLQLAPTNVGDEETEKQGLGPVFSGTSSTDDAPDLFSVAAAAAQPHGHRARGRAVSADAGEGM